MANSFTKQIIEEGPRNAIVKVAAIIDTSDIMLAPAVALADFLNNDTRLTLVGLRMDFIDYSSGPNIVTLVEWNSNSPQLIAAFAQSDELDMRVVGGACPDQTISGYDGGVNIKTKGFIPGNIEAFTVILRMVKLYKV